MELGGGGMNMFQKAIKDGPLKCDICGGDMRWVHGCGFDNDCIYCADPKCRAEIVYPTSTIFEYETDNQKGKE